MLRAVSLSGAEIQIMNTMSSGEAPSVEACIDALDEAMMQLAHHSAHALAVALAVHLQGVIGVLHERNECSAQQIRRWFEEIVRGTYGDEC